MSHSDSITSFEDLQNHTIKVVRQIYQDSQNKLWLSNYWEYIFTRLMAIIAIGGFVLYLLFTTWNMAPNVIERQFGITWMSGRIGNMAFVVGVTILYLILVIPTIIIIDNMSRMPRMLFRIAYFALLLPLSFLMIADLVSCYLNKCTVVTINISYFLAWCLTIDAVCLVLVATYIYIAAQLPYWFFFILTKPIHTERSAFLPTYDSIISESIDLLAPKIVHWKEVMVIETIETAQQKYSSLGAQAQTISPAIGTFSLFGLFALLFSQQELRDFLSFIEKNLGTEFTNVLAGAIVLTVILLFYLSMQYFIRIVISMRILDITLALLKRRLQQLKFVVKPDKEGYVLVDSLYLPESSHIHKIKH